MAAALGAALGVLTACADDRRSVTGPDAPDVPAPRAAALASAEPYTPAPTVPGAREVAADAVADALGRVLGAHEPGPELLALRRALAELGRALEAPSAASGELLGAATRAERVLEALERRHAGEPSALAELAAVRLVLERVPDLAP